MPSFRPASIRVHPLVDAAYAKLEAAAATGKRTEAAVWKAVRTSIARIQKDAQWGEVIPAASIPAILRRRYGLTNLYCIDLAGFRRGFCTTEGRVVVMLDIVDHATYDRWFANRGK